MNNKRTRKFKKKNNKITTLEHLKLIYEIFTHNVLFWQHA